MGKSKILIKEETSKDAQGNTLLNRKVIANMVNHTEVIYEDVILAKDFLTDSSPLSNFQRWAIKHHLEKDFNEEK